MLKVHMRYLTLLVFMLITGMAYSQTQSDISGDKKAEHVCMATNNTVPNSFNNAKKAVIDSTTVRYLTNTQHAAIRTANGEDYFDYVLESAAMLLITAGLEPLFRLGNIEGDLTDNVPQGV